MQKSATVPQPLNRRPYLRFLAIIVPVLLATITFSGVLGNSFTNWDDNVYVTNNPLIRSLSFQNICRIFSPSTFVCGNYHPLTVLTLAVNYSLGRLDPRGYIAVDLVLHLFNILLVFLFVRKISKSDLVASLCALLFGIHPMHVESVAWVADRKDLLCTFFYLAALIFYVRSIENAGSKRAFAYGLAVVLAIPALLSKSAGITLPFALLLIDYHQGRKFSAGSFLEKIPVIVPAFLIGMLAIKGQHSYGALNIGYAPSIIDKICIGSYSFMFYIEKLFAPVSLSALYPYPLAGALPFSYAVAPLVTIAIAGLVVYCRRSKVIVFGFFFFLVNIIFIVHFIPVGATITADRFSYLSSIGLFYIVAYGFRKALSAGFMKNVPVYAAGCSIIALLCIASSQRCGVWKSSLTLWTDAVANQPCAAACNILGNTLMATDDPFGALCQFQKAIELSPNNAEGYENMGKAYMQIGRNDAAAVQFRKALELSPADAVLHNNLGVTLFKTGKVDEAVANLQQAIELSPGFAEAHCNLGNAMLGTGRAGEAVIHYRKAAEFAGNFPELTIGIFSNLGEALLKTGQIDSAIGSEQKALALASSLQREDLVRDIGLKIGEMQNTAHSGSGKY